MTRPSGDGYTNARDHAGEAIRLSTESHALTCKRA
jgi:hypothetical protein